MAFSPHLQMLPELDKNLETENAGKRPSRCFEESLSPISAPKMLRLDESYSDKLRSSPNTSIRSPSILVVGTDRRNKKKRRVSFAKKPFVQFFQKCPPDIVAPIAESVKLRRRNSIENAEPVVNEKSTDLKRKEANLEEKEKDAKKRSFSDKVQCGKKVFQTNAKFSAGKSKADGVKSRPSKPASGPRPHPRKPDESAGNEKASPKRRKRRNILFAKTTRLKQKKKMKNVPERNEKLTMESKNVTRKFPDWETDERTTRIRKAMKEDYDKMKILYQEKDSLDPKKADKNYVAGNCYQDPEVLKLLCNLSKTVNELADIDGAYSLRKGSIRPTRAKKDGESSELVKRKKSEKNSNLEESSVVSENLPGFDRSQDTLDPVLTEISEVAEKDSGSANPKSPENSGEAAEVERRAEKINEPPGEKELDVDEINPREDESEKSEPVESESLLSSTPRKEGEDLGEAISVWDGAAPDRDLEEDDRSTVIFDESETAPTSSNLLDPFERPKVLWKERKRRRRGGKAKPESANRRSVGSGKRIKKIRILKKKRIKLLKKKITVGSRKKQEEKTEPVENVSRVSKLSESLKGISGLIKRLHESHQIILFLEKDMASKPELADHYKPVISAQYSNYRKYISEYKSAILKGFDEMSASNEKASDFYLLISKEALLTVEEVSQVISRCILVEDVPEATDGPSCSVTEKARKESPSKLNVIGGSSKRSEIPRSPGTQARTSKPVSRVLPTAKVATPVVPAPRAKDVYDFVSSEDDSSAEKKFPRRVSSGGRFLRPGANDSVAGCNRFLRSDPSSLMSNAVPVLTYSLPVLTYTAPAIPKGGYYLLNNLQPRPNFVPPSNVPGRVEFERPQTDVPTAVQTRNRPENAPVCQKPPMPVLYRVTKDDRGKLKGLPVKIAHDRSGIKFVVTSRVAASNAAVSAPENPSPANPPTITANADEPSRISPPLRSTQRESQSVPQRGSPSSAIDHQYAAPLPRNKSGPAKRKAAPETSPENNGSARTDAARFENFATSRLSVPPSPKPVSTGPTETAERNQSSPDSVSDNSSVQKKAMAQLIELSKQLVELRARRRSEIKAASTPSSDRNDTPITARKRTSPRGTYAKSPEARPESPPTRRSPRNKPEDLDLSRVKIETSPERNSNGVPVKTETRSPEDKEESETEDGENSTDDECFLDLDSIKKELEDNHDLIHFICAENKCMKPGTKICTGCGRVLYCGKKCQAKHWNKKHHKHCQQLREQAEERKKAKSTRNDQQD